MAQNVGTIIVSPNNITCLLLQKPASKRILRIVLFPFLSTLGGVMKYVAFCAVFCCFLFVHQGSTQTLGFGFEFYNRQNMLNFLLYEGEMIDESYTFVDMVSPVIYCDINVENTMKIQPHLGLLLGDGSGDNALFLSGGLGLFALRNPRENISIYYGIRGGVHPWFVATSSTPVTNWFATATIGGEYIIASHFSIGIESGLGYNHIDSDRHFLSSQTKILLRYYVM